MFTYEIIEQAIQELKQANNITNFEVISTIEYLSDYSNWTFEEIRNMFLDSNY